VPFPGFPGLTMPAEFLDQIRDYRAGQSYTESWHQAPFGPAFPGRTLFSLLPDFSGAPVREGDTLLLEPSMFSDQATPARGSLSQASVQLTLSRDGQVLAGNPAVIDVPPDPALYRLDVDATRPDDTFSLSTHVTAAWTFHSQHADGTVVL